MGKTTRFHPLPLHVIRGSAEYCGYKIGKLQQTKADPEQGTARYNGVLEEFPFDPEKFTLTDIGKAFQQCFMNDIHVDYVLLSRSGQYVFGLKVKPRRKIAGEKAGSDGEV